jgi:hypothetical protein
MRISGSVGSRANPRFDVRLLAQRQHEAADEAHDARDFGERDRDDHVADARLGERHQRDGEQHRGIDISPSITRITTASTART